MDLNEQQRELFAKRIKDERYKKGWSQKHITEQLGLSRSNTVCNWEYGHRTPRTLETVERLAEMFDVTTDYLIGRTNRPQGTAKDDELLQELEITDTQDLLSKYNFTVDRQPLTERQALMALDLVRSFIRSERDILGKEAVTTR